MHRKRTKNYSRAYRKLKKNAKVATKQQTTTKYWAGALFITVHHHLALSILVANNKAATVSVGALIHQWEHAGPITMMTMIITA